MAVAFMHIIRLAAFGVVLLFSLITLGLSADITHTTESDSQFYFKFAAMGIAVSLLTMLTLPVLIAVDFIRRGAFTSLVAVELGWIGILWVLWLATGALAADAGLFLAGCQIYSSGSITATACHEYQAIEAFSFLAWLALLGYWILLLVASIIGATRGHNIWTSTVKDNLFFTPNTNRAVPGEVKYEAQYPQQQYAQPTGQYPQQPQAQQYPQQYPPPQQQQYPAPQQYPPQQGTPTPSVPQSHSPYSQV